MSSVRRSLLLSLADSYLALVLQIASTVIISRLLTPTEIGVFAIAVVFVALANTFRDFGVAEYLIQERDLTVVKIRAALALNIIISWSMSLLLVLIALPVSHFYHEPGVAHVMWVQALNFLLIPFGAVVQAWFRRELNYRPIVICNVLSSVVAFSVAVGLAYQGFSYMSLAWSSLAGIVVTVLAVAFFRPPTFPTKPSLQGIRQVFRFSKFASAVYIVAQIGKGTPELLIGRALGIADVGMYSRANGLVEIFHRLLMRPTLQVCMPYFARSNRENGSLVPAYLASVSLLTAVGWPFLAFLAVIAYAAIRIVYGPQWLQAVPISQVLCLAAAIELTFLLSREALLSCGDARRANTMQLQLIGLRILGLMLVFPFGLPGVAVGLVIAALLGLGVSQWHLQHSFGLCLADLLRALASSSVLLLVTVIPAALLAMIWPPAEHNFMHWAVWGTLLAGMSWLVTLRLLHHQLWDELVGIIGRLSGRRATST